MVAFIEGEDSLRRMFCAYIEQTFQVELGIADPPLTDYLTDMLLRFVHSDVIYRVRNIRGRRLEQVGDPTYFTKVKGWFGSWLSFQRVGP